jgi:arylsulfatase A-like enzyme/Tfp pilus assembly protein PilF
LRFLRHGNKAAKRRFSANDIFRFLLFIFLSWGAHNLTASAITTPPPASTNVLLITVDTLRYDRVGILCDRYVKTPNLDAFAREGVIFTRAFAHDPLTRPSHANIMTGTTSLYHGVVDNPGYSLEKKFLTLAEYLKEKQYQTAAFVSAMVLDSRSGFAQGFDLYNDDNGEQPFGAFVEVERRADTVIRLSQQWISGQKDAWFCWVHIFDPHDPYEPPEPFKQQYADDPYSGEVAFVDSQLGLLFDFLRESGQFGKTIIIVVSDHGEALGEKNERTHGFFAYNNTLHIPLFIYYPGVKPRQVNENVCHADIFPTVCDLLSLTCPSHVQGESLLPIIAGGGRQKKMIFFESMAPNNGMDAAPLTGFIQGNTKFIDLPIKEVYDLEADVNEENNLASTADIPQLIGSLETLKKNLKGKGTKQDLGGKNAEILPYLRSLGYVAGTPSKDKKYGVGDDPKSLHPLIMQLRQAIEEAESGQLESAVNKIRTVIRIRPTYVSAHATLSKIYYGHGKMDEAIATLRDGLVKNPGNIILTGTLGIMLVLAKQYDEGISVLEECTRRAKFNPEYFNYLGLAYMNVGEFDPAREKFKQALEIDPTLVASYNNLGYLYLMLYIKTKDRRQLDSAIANFDKALAFDPDRPSVLKGRDVALNYKKQRQSP